MRLSKPSFDISLPLFMDYEDILGGQKSAKTDGLDCFGLSEYLTLPHTFGTIYLGETFSCYVSINNTSLFDVSNATVKAEIQTTTTRSSLLDITTTPIQNFGSGESHDYVLQHEVKDVGIHILVFNLEYTNKDNERKRIPSKFFKFQVSNPLLVKTETASIGHSVMLTAQLKNGTSSLLFLETIKFDPTPFFNVTDLNNLDHRVEQFLLKPNDTYQFLFKVEPKNPNDIRAQSAPQLGKIDIVWKTKLGETGRLQTVTLERKAAKPVDIELKIKEIPPKIMLEMPFVVKCEITNRSEQAILPQLFFNQTTTSGGILGFGISGQHLEKIDPGKEISVPLTLFPIRPGVQKISGLKVTDRSTEKTYEFKDIVDVFIESG